MSEATAAPVAPAAAPATPVTPVTPTPATPAAAPAATPAAAAAPTATPPGEEWRAMPTDKFTERLASERDKGMKALLKDLGFDKPEDAKALVEAARKKADAEKTEIQRLTEAQAALAPKAQRAEVLEKTLLGYLEREEAAIPADKKGLLKLAPSADNVAARLDWISEAKGAGLFAVAPTAPVAEPPKPANPATTIAPQSPAGTQPAPTLTAAQQWKKLQSEGQTFAASRYYTANRSAIDAELIK